MTWIATQSFKEVDHLLGHASPTARLELKPLGANARAVLLYQAAEQNRSYFKIWETDQIILGSLFFLMMLFGSREQVPLLAVLLLMVVLTGLQRFLLTPELSALGKVLDFLPPDAEMPVRHQFWVLHTWYVGVEAGKWLLCLVLTGQLVFSRRRSGRSRDSRSELDRVNKPDYRRVNR